MDAKTIESRVIDLQVPRLARLVSKPEARPDACVGEATVQWLGPEKTRQGRRTDVVDGPCGVAVLQPFERWGRPSGSAPPTASDTFWKCWLKRDIFAGTHDVPGALSWFGLHLRLI